MAVSKTLRFQVLRRDGFRCQYCGTTAGEGVTLVVDHVMPVALGGTDTADNLTTSCAGCNSGKGSMPPDAENVAQVDQRNVEWAAALERAKSQEDEKRDDRRRKVYEFIQIWDEWSMGDWPLPDGFDQAVLTWLNRGLTLDDFRDLILVTVGKSGIYRPDRFRYFAGCCWRRITHLEEEAARIMEQADGD